MGTGTEAPVSHEVRHRKEQIAPSLGAGTKAPISHEVRYRGKKAGAGKGLEEGTDTITYATLKETPMPPSRTEWAKVVGRKETRKERYNLRNSAVPRAPTKASPKRPPKTVAVQISCRGETKYSEIMRLAKEKINIEELGITSVKPCKARSSALLLKIPGGPDGAGKANLLAERLSQVTADDTNVVISRPEKMPEIRLKDLEASITREEIRQCIGDTGRGDCNDIKVGDITEAPNGLGSVWIKCPLRVAPRCLQSTEDKDRVDNEQGRDAP